MYKLKRIIIPDELEVALIEDCNFNFKRHFHNSFCIGFIIKGQRLINIKNQNQILEKGSIFILKPGEIHTCTVPEKILCSYLVISVSENRYKNLLIEKMKLWEDIEINLSNFIENDSSIQPLFIELLTLIKNDQKATEFQEVIFKILRLIFSIYNKEIADKKSIIELQYVIEKAKQFIERNYDRDISLDEISDNVGISKFHLSRLFYKSVGLNMHEYLVQLRIKRVSKMLDKGQSLAEIAYVNNFTDQSYFSRVFKKYNGLTPGKYVAAKKTIQ